MLIDLSHRPRLRDMKRLGPPAPSVTEARRRGPSATPAASLADRTGYDPDFLGDFMVPLPSPMRAGDVFGVPGSPDGRLDYMHFSVVMSKSRRLAMFVGVNIDGLASVKIDRADDKWFLDGRIPIEAQVGEDLYADNLLDRGHLVRREDPNWGPDAAIANDDTFHFTNCAPQMAGFNQRTWLELENYVLHNTRRWRERVTVFSGPVFSGSDRVYRGVRIPTAFWKVIAFVSDDGRPSATAYMISQAGQLSRLEADFGAFKTYQRSVRSIEELTDLDFGDPATFDGFSNEERETGTRIEAVLRSPADIRI